MEQDGAAITNVAAQGKAGWRDLMRVPATGPKIKKRDELLAYYRKRLAEFQRMPEHRREAECADEAEATCRAMIAELEKQN